MRISFVSLLVILILSSCEKPGTGGKARLSIHVIRSATSSPVGGATVYIKYGATEFPGADPINYDAQQVADNSGRTDFFELKRGDYYLYAVGMDTVAGVMTAGGVTFDIRNKVGERDLVIETKP
jgi:hypothetical protein